MAAVVFAAVVVYGEKAKTKSGPPEQSSAHEAEQTDSGAGRTVIAVNQQTPEGKGNDHAKEPQSYFFRLFAPENLPNVALVLVGIGGIITAVYTLRIIKVQTDATVVAANAANKSAEIAEKGLISTERAFVYAEQIKWHRVIENNRVSGWLFSNPWKNSGTTQAEDAKCFINALQFNGSMPDWFPFSDGEGPGRTAEFVLGPQQVKESGLLFVPIDRMLKLFRGEVRMFLYGWIIYRDVFKGSHITRFCTEIDRVTGGDPLDLQATVDFLFKDWKRFNCTDEQCERQEAECYAEMPPEALAIFTKEGNRPPRRPA